MRRFWIDGFVPAPWNGVLALLWIPNRLFDALGFLLLFIAAEWTIGRFLVSACAALACVGLIVLGRHSPWKASLIVAPAAAAILASSVRLLPFQGRVSLYAGWPLLVLAMAGLEAIHKLVAGRRTSGANRFGRFDCQYAAGLVLLVHPPPYLYSGNTPGTLLRLQAAGNPAIASTFTLGRRRLSNSMEGAWA